MSRLNIDWGNFNKNQRKEKFLEKKENKTRVLMLLANFCLSENASAIKVNYQGQESTLKKFAEAFTEDAKDSLWAKHEERSREAKKRAGRRQLETGQRPAN